MSRPSRLTVATPYSHGHRAVAVIVLRDRELRDFPATDQAIRGGGGITEGGNMPDYGWEVDAVESGDRMEPPRQLKPRSRHSGRVQRHGPGPCGTAPETSGAAR